MRQVVALAVLAACEGSPAGPGRPQETGLGHSGAPGHTGTPGDRDTADPSSDPTTADTGPTATDPGEPPSALVTPGCPVSFAPVPADLSGCVARWTVTGGLYGSWLAAGRDTYDELGRLVLVESWDDDADFVYTWAYDPLTGDVLRETDDQDHGDDLTTRDYPWTRDAQGRVVEMEVLTTWGGRSFPTQQPTTRITYTWGPCGVEVALSSAGGTTTTEWYEEGTRNRMDADQDGLPEWTEERWVEPATGFPTRAFLQRTGASTPTWSFSDVRDPATGWLLGQSGYSGASDQESTWTYDAEGRALTEHRDVHDTSYGYRYTYDTVTTWTCPP